METLAEAGREAVAAAAAYARSKEAYLDTARVCAAQGVAFQPMVLESTGAWEKGSGKILWHIARAVAVSEGAKPATMHSTMLQELSVVARSHRARAVLRRRAALGAAAL